MKTPFVYTSVELRWLDQHCNAPAVDFALRPFLCRAVRKLLPGGDRHKFRLRVASKKFAGSKRVLLQEMHGAGRLAYGWGQRGPRPGLYVDLDIGLFRAGIRDLLPRGRAATFYVRCIAPAKI